MNIFEHIGSSAFETVKAAADDQRGYAMTNHQGLGNALTSITDHPLVILGVIVAAGVGKAVYEWQNRHPK